MNELTEKCKGYLEELDAQYEYDSDDCLFIVDSIIEIDRYRFILKIHEEENWLVCYGLFPERINDSSSDEIIKYITKMNNLLAIGGFVYSEETNLLKFKNSVDLEDVEFTKRILINIVVCCMSMLEEHENELMQINQ